MPGALAFTSIAELRVRLDSRDVSAEELARLALTGLESQGQADNIVTAWSVERALEEARQADRLIRDGRQTSVTGIPYGVKDQLAARGMPTSWGSPVYEGRRFDYDATAVNRLQHAGGVLVAKLAMMELGGAGGYRSAGASASGATRNPWNRGHWAGGSSGGSAAVVGAGLLPYALAGDSLGSIILPAAFCGVTGLRPTFGAVSRFGSMPGSWTLGKVGVICRSAADCACVLRLIAGADSNDPLSSDGLDSAPPRLPHRVGVLPAEDSQTTLVSELMRSALQALRDLGFELRPVSLPDQRDYVDLAKRLRAGEVVAAHEDLIRDPDQLSLVVDPRQREGLQAFLGQPTSSYPRAVQERAYARQEIMRLFGDVDFLVTASVPQEAPALDADLSDQPFRQSRHMALGALADLPGASIPIGFGESGLPVGMTIIGRPFWDFSVLEFAKRYQEATDWHLRIPSREVIGAHEGS